MLPRRAARVLDRPTVRRYAQQSGGAVDTLEVHALARVERPHRSAELLICHVACRIVLNVFKPVAHQCFFDVAPGLTCEALPGVCVSDDETLELSDRVKAALDRDVGNELARVAERPGVGGAADARLDVHVGEGAERD